MFSCNTTRLLNDPILILVRHHGTCIYRHKTNIDSLKCVYYSEGLSLFTVYSTDRYVHVQLIQTTNLHVLNIRIHVDIQTTKNTIVLVNMPQCLIVICLTPVGIERGRRMVDSNVVDFGMYQLIYVPHSCELTVHRSYQSDRIETPVCKCRAHLAILIFN